MLLAFFAVLLVLGYGLGRQLQKRREVALPAWLVSATVVWLAFSLSVSLLSASQQHQQRQNWLHEECDGIAHVYRLLQTLPRNERAQMRLLLLAYLDANLRNGEGEEEATSTHSQLYALATRMVKSKIIGDHQGSLLTQSLSRMISVHHRTDFALRQRTPAAEWIALGSACFLVAALVGYGTSARDRFTPLVLALLTLTGLSLLLDFNRPGQGLVQVDRKNLQDLSRTLHQKEKL